MIRTETIDGGARMRTYSDAGMRLRQVETGALYDEAIDIAPSPYTYEETDIPLPELTADEALEILTGGGV